MGNYSKYLSSLSGRPVSRRKFMQASGALGMAGAAPQMFLGSAAHAAPVKGGHLTVAMPHGSSTDSLDPTRLISGHALMGFYTIHCTLTEISSHGELKPLLAESFEFGEDASEWIFKLRSGVTFHNGKTVTSDDVIASLNRHRGDDSASSMKAFIEDVESITKDGDQVVKFKLKNPSVDFPVVLTDGVLSILPSKDGMVDTFDVGCGGYMLDGIEPGQYSRYKRNPNFFLSDRAYLDTAELLTIADSTARQNALVTGAIDVCGNIDQTTASLLGRDENVNILNVNSTKHYTFPMRTDLAPFDNNDVRMALKLSIDRDAVLDTVLGGYGNLGNDHPISPVNRYYNHELEQRVYDPEKAKWHLKQAGMENLKVELSASDSLYRGCVDTAVLFSEHAKASGIELVPKQVPDDGYWSDSGSSTHGVRVSGVGDRLKTGCSPKGMQRLLTGMKPTGKMSASTNFWSRPDLSWMTTHVATCIGKCKPLPAMIAVRSFMRSPIMFQASEPLSAYRKQLPETGTMTAINCFCAGGATLDSEPDFR